MVGGPRAYPLTQAYIYSIPLLIQIRACNNISFIKIYILLIFNSLHLSISLSLSRHFDGRMRKIMNIVSIEAVSDAKSDFISPRT